MRSASLRLWLLVNRRPAAAAAVATFLQTAVVLGHPGIAATERSAQHSFIYLSIHSFIHSLTFSRSGFCYLSYGCIHSSLVHSHPMIHLNLFISSLFFIHSLIHSDSLMSTNHLWVSLVSPTWNFDARRQIFYHWTLQTKALPSPYLSLWRTNFFHGNAHWLLLALYVYSIQG